MTPLHAPTAYQSHCFETGQTLYEADDGRILGAGGQVSPGGQPEPSADLRQRLAVVETQFGVEFSPAQRSIVLACAARRSAYLAGATGTGKTLMSLAIRALWQPRRTLVIAPKGTVQGQDAQWVKAIEGVLGIDYEDQTVRDGIFLNHPAQLIGGFRWDKDYFDLVIVDESHIFANLESAQTLSLISLRPKYRLALSATPAPNSVLDLFPALGWLYVDGWGDGNVSEEFPFSIHSLSEFERRFVMR